MALKIFEIDPDAAPKAKFADDIVMRFRSGAQLQGRPMALSEWRVTTGDPDVADSVAGLFGGSPAPWDTKTEETTEVYTDAREVRIILAGPDAVRTSMVLWGRNNLIRSCDGVTQKSVDGKPGAPCACPSTVKERKEAATAGHGCQPSIQIYFRLADAPDMGKGKFFSGSWSFAAEVGAAEAELAKIGGPALATLSLEKVEYTTKAGREVSYTKPVLTVLGPAPHLPTVSAPAAEEEPF